MDLLRGTSVGTPSSWKDGLFGPPPTLRAALFLATEQSRDKVEAIQ